MPRFYGTIIRPSTNKAATPELEQKGGKPTTPPKSEEKKDEGGKK